VEQIVAGAMNEVGRRSESFGTKGAAFKDWLYSSLPDCLSKGFITSAAANVGESFDLPIPSSVADKKIN
jgi:hypothetical protein